MLSKSGNRQASSETDQESQPISASTAIVDMSHIHTWVFDLDNTLYSSDLDLFSQVDKRMGEFISEALALCPEEAKALQKHYYRTYGTTLRGLMMKHGVEPEPFLDYVHNIDLDEIEKDLELDSLLDGLPGRKLVFTNGSYKHAERVTTALGIERHFEAIFDVTAAGYVPKHETEVFQAFCAEFELETQSAVMFDDISLNLLHPHNSGMTTVWVRTNIDWSENHDDVNEGTHIHHETDDLVDFLRRVRHSSSPENGSAADD